MFEQIVILEPTGLQPWALEALQAHSIQPLLAYDSIPESGEEIVDRIKAADCVFISWNVQLTATILSQCPRLRYIGMCCSLYSAESANVDMGYAQKHNITVTGIRDYGDEGLVEYIVSELIRLMKGIGGQQWREEPVELTRKKIGIIGMGATGKMLANRLQAFGADIYYHSRNQKPDADQQGYEYLALSELLQTCEIISLHLPKNTCILNENEFETFGKGKILINTSLGFTFDKAAFTNWINAPGNFAIFDGDGIGSHEYEFEAYPNVISTQLVSGWTKEAKERLSRKVLNNLKNFVNTAG